MSGYEFDPKDKDGSLRDRFDCYCKEVIGRAAHNLVFKQENNFIKEQAREKSYENLEKILEAIARTKVRLRANVNFELAMELLFLTIREK